MCGHRRVPEHILLYDGMVQSLEHALHQDEVEQEGGDVDPMGLRLRYCGQTPGSQFKESEECVNLHTVIVIINLS